MDQRSRAYYVAPDVVADFCQLKARGLDRVQFTGDRAGQQRPSDLDQLLTWLKAAGGTMTLQLWLYKPDEWISWIEVRRRSRYE